MPIDITPGSKLFANIPNSTVNVWMSHGDEAVKLPEGFVTVAKSRQVGPRRQPTSLLRGSHSPTDAAAPQAATALDLQLTHAPKLAERD